MVNSNESLKSLLVKGKMFAYNIIFNQYLNNVNHVYKETITQ